MRYLRNALKNATGNTSFILHSNFNVKMKAHLFVVYSRSTFKKEALRPNNHVKSFFSGTKAGLLLLKLLYNFFCF